MLRFRNVQKSYHGKPILVIPALDLDKGIYWLQGANGSGKTTLLRIIAGLLPFDGDVLCQNISLHQKPVAYRNCIGWADAEPLYPDYVTGKELVSLYRRIRKATPEQINKLVTVFQIEYFLAQPIGTYSSGMIKKLSLVLAFIGSPSLILLDEPLTTLDAEGVPALLELIKEYNEASGVGFILSSHHDVALNALPVHQKLFVAEQQIFFPV